MRKTINILISHTDLDDYVSQLFNLFRMDKSLLVDLLTAYIRLYTSKDENGNIDSFIIKDGDDEEIYCNFYNFDYSNVSEGIRNIFDTKNLNDNVVYNVYITDLNLDMSTANYLNELKTKGIINQLELIDHHITGKDVALKYPEWYNLTVGDSATKLVYDRSGIKHYTEGDYLLELVEIVDAADLFKTKNSNVFEAGRCLNNILEPIFKSVKNVSHTRFLVWWYIIQLLDSESLNDLVNGSSLYYRMLYKEDNIGRFRVKSLFSLLNALLNNVEFNRTFIYPTYEEINHPYHVLYYKNQIRTMLHNGQIITTRVDDKDIKFVVIDNHNGPVSDVSYYALKERKDIHFLVYLLPNGVASFRSYIEDNGDVRYDVSKIAKEFGGGGHMAAAGAKLDDSITNEKIIEELISIITNFKKENND